MDADQEDLFMGHALFVTHPQQSFLSQIMNIRSGSVTVGCSQGFKVILNILSRNLVGTIPKLNTLSVKILIKCEGETGKDMNVYAIYNIFNDFFLRRQHHASCSYF